MWAFIDKIPYSILIAISVLMILAPFKPMPHVLEKLIMLKNGTLTNQTPSLLRTFANAWPLAAPFKPKGLHVQKFTATPR